MRISKWSIMSWFLWDGLVSVQKGEDDKEQGGGGGLNVKANFLLGEVEE